MHGWRARIGLIIPHVNMTMEPEINSVLPRGASAHAARMVIPQLDPEGLVRMAEDALRAADQLSELDADVVVFGCTSGSFVGGQDHESDLVKRIAGRVGCPTLSTSGAGVQALRALGVTRVAVATPYDDTINQRLGAFFAAHGLDVVSLVGLGLRERTAHFPLARTPVSAIAQQSEEVVYRLARAAARPDVEALFISCTNLSTLGLVAELESDLSIPVVTANQASFWAAFRAAGLGDSPAAFGSLGRY
ncbi:maleate cis-trans isomerase [Micromonospora sonchi]|uniref:Maleate cis-trans isomerase n=2 Tax=Micromonospora sonchi TaxID=1763543 RepID=A0A917X2K5_9ACTN|nr:maleate cis-trans isomerase [Micromonospora sonchi]